MLTLISLSLPLKIGTKKLLYELSQPSPCIRMVRWTLNCVLPLMYEDARMCSSELAGFSYLRIVYVDYDLKTGAQPLISISSVNSNRGHTRRITERGRPPFYREFYTDSILFSKWALSGGHYDGYCAFLSWLPSFFALGSGTKLISLVLKISSGNFYSV